MPDISIQFHALPEELVDFLGQCVSEYHLHVVEIAFPPYHAQEVPRESLGDVLSGSSTVRAIALTVGKPVIADGSKDFRDENPDALHLDIGRRGQEGVKESHLWARTSNLKVIAVWKTIAKKLKAITTQGAIATNPDTGASAPAKWHRFTEGARKLEASGVPMLSITGIILKPVTSAAK